MQFFAKFGVHMVERGSPTGAQGGDQVVVVAGVEVELFAFDEGSSFADALDVLGDGGYVPLARMAVVGVGGRSASEVGDTLPVAAVVARMHVREAEVGDFVVLIARSGELPDHPSHYKTRRI